jgi:UDP-2,3-diacylglucosamine pyrophosphatase LpxH
MALSYRSVFISDVHLGTHSSRADELLDFLTELAAEKIYLVGDIIDLQRMKSRPMFPDHHMRVIAELARFAAAGTEVVFIPGNHDHEFRSVAGREIFGIPVALEAEHRTPAGDKLLVTHGDLLDGRIRKGTSLEKFGAAAYRFLTDADALLNRWRRALGRDYVSYSATIKRRLSGAQEYIRRFEAVAVEYADERGFDGIVCGHIHRPNLRRIDGLLYANDGDWVEHGTALAETQSGDLELVGWQSEIVTLGLTMQSEQLAA